MGIGVSMVVFLLYSDFCNFHLAHKASFTKFQVLLSGISFFYKIKQSDTVASGAFGQLLILRFTIWIVLVFHELNNPSSGFFCIKHSQMFSQRLTRGLSYIPIHFFLY